MKNKEYRTIISSLVPIVLFFLLIGIADVSLKKYTVHGPVGLETGQPLLDSFPNLIYYGFIALIVAGVLYSCFQIRRIQGWKKYVSLLIVIAAIPIQYVFIIALQVSLFGK